MDSEKKDWVKQLLSSFVTLQKLPTLFRIITKKLETVDIRAVRFPGLLLIYTTQFNKLIQNNYLNTDEMI